ncbi:hypothetical protein OSTOST_26005 [Ostertagia ostertagi]
MHSPRKHKSLAPEHPVIQSDTHCASLRVPVQANRNSDNPTTRPIHFQIIVPSTPSTSRLKVGASAKQTGKMSGVSGEDKPVINFDEASEEQSVASSKEPSLIPSPGAPSTSRAKSTSPEPSLMDTLMDELPLEEAFQLLYGSEPGDDDSHMVVSYEDSSVCYHEGIHPVLYRVKSLLARSRAWSRVHMEVPLPDAVLIFIRSTLEHSRSRSARRNATWIFHLLIGDLVWVYSLTPSKKFLKEGVPYPETIEQACHHRRATVWRVDRFGLIHRDLKETLGYVITIASKAYQTFQVCMKGHRTVVTVNRNRLNSDVDFTNLQPNSFITAPFRPRQLDYMLFACEPTPIAFNHLREFLADVQYFPSAPPAPFDVRPTSAHHQNWCAAS